MGFWDFLRGNSAAGLDAASPLGGSEVDYAWFSPRVEYLGGAEWADRVAEEWAAVRSMTAAQLWSTQPHLRTVVSFLARNVAQLGLHVFERVNDSDRRRDRTSPLARALAAPDVEMTAYELIFALVGDKALYDRAYWLVGVSDVTGAPQFRRLPPSWVSPIRKDAYTLEGYRVALNGRSIVVPAERMLAFPGYSPTSPSGCSPALDALKETLGEQIEASKYRSQVWKRGGRTSAVLTRPADAPWSDAAREQFREDWYAKYTGDGSLAGGTPILEDGMKLERIDFSASDQQWVEGAKLAFATCASAFHVNPTMVGILDNANFSNVREFRRMLYGDTLGPLLAEIEARINTFLLPMLGMDNGRFYAEFNINEKMQGSFEEQTQAMQSSVGRPWMTADEARARLNMPALGGDAGQLVTPLNVLVGGQASPRDSGSQNEAAGPSRGVKAAPSSTERKKAEQVLSAFFKRQARVVLSALGSKDDAEWWDAQRWDRELAADLLALSVTVTERTAKRAIEAAGGNPDDYDIDRTVRYLQAVAARTASSINATTLAQLEDAIDDDEADPADVFEQASGSRSALAAVTLTTALSGFATTEAGKQSGAATKTWIVNSRNPRASHAAMAGETVPIEDDFSNGMAWPGDSSDADEVAGCSCDVEFNYP